MTEQNKLHITKHTKKAQKLVISIIAIFCAFFIMFTLPPLIIFGVSGGVYAAAETEEKESSGIMRELSGFTK